MSVSPKRLAPWEDFVLRLIALWKLCHAVFFTAVGFGLLRLRGHNVVDFLNAHIIIPYHLNPENREINWLLDKADALTSHRLLLLGYAAFFYAALFAAEGIGLYLRKHWAEWLVVVVTGSLLPLEVYEFWVKVALWKFAAVFGNLLIVGYLIHRLLLDARLKAARLEQAERESAANPASGLNGKHLTSANRVATSSPVSTKIP